MYGRSVSSSKSIIGRSERSVEKLSKHTNSPTTKEHSVVSSPNGIVVFDNHSTTVEVTVKTKGKKTPSSSSTSQSSNIKQSPGHGKTMEEKKRSSVNEIRDWNRILKEQNQTILKQSLQKLSGHSYPEQTKTSKHNPSENRETRKSVDSRRSSKYNVINDFLDEIPVKQSAPSRKSQSIQRYSTTSVPSNHSIASRAESVIVIDRGVQCGGIFDVSNNSFGLLNPVRALGVLMKELEALVDDEKVSKILTQMEQALLRIPVEQGKPSPADLQAIAAKTMLEASTAKLTATSKLMEESYKSVRKENTMLQQHIEELSILLNQGKQRENTLEGEIKRLRLELNDASKFDLANRKIISDLREEREALKKQLNDERELAEQKSLEFQCIKLENERLTVMASIKDSQLIEHRNAAEGLKREIVDQLDGIIMRSSNDEGIDVDVEHIDSVVIRGKACSSPTRSSSNSVAPLSWLDVSEVSASSEDIAKHSDHTNDFDGDKFVEKTPLEFVSLACEESSPTQLSIINLDGSEPKLIEIQNANQSEYSKKIMKQRHIPLSASRKSRSPGEDTLVAPENIRQPYSKSIKNTIKEEIDMMFENMRKTSRPQVKVPSPPRNFPRPNWSDSSLPTLSITESNVT